MSLALEYNSKREKLIIPEYGRHIQHLIQHAVSIENDEERQAFTAYIVKLMEAINPSNDSGDDLKEKLWKHAVIISDYKLEVTMPNGEPIEKRDNLQKPSHLGYPKNNAKDRHYGQNVIEMIHKAMQMEDTQKQKEFAVAIGSYMKIAYQNWHPEHYASDEMIKEDLKRISKGKLALGESDTLDFLSQSKNRSRSRKKGRRRSGRSRKRR